MGCGSYTASCPGGVEAGSMSRSGSSCAWGLDVDPDVSEPIMQAKFETSSTG